VGVVHGAHYGRFGIRTRVSEHPLEPCPQAWPENGWPGGSPVPAGCCRGRRDHGGAAAHLQLRHRVLIPAQEFQPGGGAYGRALAYLAHLYLGNGFGIAYDVSTIAILWFAGASAMADLLNMVPRYGMAPAWALAARPLVLVFAAVAFLVTGVFDADVDAQAGAYATGVLVLITSAAFAVTLSARRRGDRMTWAYVLITLVFAVTTVANMVERPDGLKAVGASDDLVVA
jgi:hypothetical protein